MVDSGARHRQLLRDVIHQDRMRGGVIRMNDIGAQHPRGQAVRGGVFWFPLIGLASTAVRVIGPAVARAAIQEGVRHGARAGAQAGLRAGGQAISRAAPREVTTFGLSGAAQRIGDLTGGTEALKNLALEGGRDVLDFIQGNPGAVGTVRSFQTDSGRQISAVIQRGTAATTGQLAAIRAAAETNQADQANVDVRLARIRGRGFDDVPVGNLSRRAAGVRMLHRMRR